MRNESEEKTKYYFYSFRISDNKDNMFHSGAIKNIHPITLIRKYNKNEKQTTGRFVVLLNWQEITKKEFELWGKCNNE
jgi:hypothetical protein